MTRLFRAFSLFLSAGAASAQPNPGTISTYSLQVGNPPASYFDALGNVYLAASATTGATPGAAQTQTGGGACPEPGAIFGVPIVVPCRDAFIKKLDTNGNTIFATLLGGPKDDNGTAATTDPAGNIYFTGTTGGQFPTTANAAITSGGAAFAAKLSADGATFLYVTYLPGAISSPSAIAVDAQGNAFIAGATASGQPCVVKVQADGSTILYTTTLGPETPIVAVLAIAPSAATALAVDASGNAFITGRTTSPAFPITTGVVQPNLAGVENAFLTKLDPNGNIIFSTYLGGSAADSALAVAVDVQGNLYVAGATSSLDFPTTSGSFEPVAMIPPWTNYPGGFVSKLNSGATSLLFSTYVPANFGSVGLVAGSSGDAYISGITLGLLPVTGSAPQPCFFDGLEQMFVAHLDANGALLDSTYTGASASFVSQMGIAGDGSILAAASNSFSRIVFGGPGWASPSCLSAVALNSATLFNSLGAPSAVTPGELVTLTGFGIGPSTGVGYQPDAQGNIAVTLSGVQVFFDGVAAPMFYAQSQQVNTQAPFELAGKSETSMTLQYNGATFGPVTLNVEPAIPGLFRLQPGVSAQAVAMNQDGTLNGPSNPAPAGSVIALWGTGFGRTDPACSTGGLNIYGAASLAGEPLVMLDFEQTATNGAAFQHAQYAGSAPTLVCGITQINVRIPAPTQSGAQSVTPWVNTNEGAPVLSIIYVK
jgi:uncharacterized protein (TIGR03437 family)